MSDLSVFVRLAELVVDVRRCRPGPWLWYLALLLGEVVEVGAVPFV